MSKKEAIDNLPLSLADYEPDLLAEFLYLIKDKFQRADKAGFFLEQHVGVASSTISVANQRDAISHFISFLSQPSSPEGSRKFQEQQIYAAEEHLRRATIEPYQYVVMEKLTLMEKLLADYEYFVLERRAKSSNTSLPTRETIDASIGKVRDLYRQGREAKTRNRWDAEWEQGILCFIGAINEIEKLRKILEPLVDAGKAELLKRNSRGAKMQLILVGVAVGLVLAGITYIAILR
ncbi:MAG: hypothetical protein WBG92_23800 [Thiohalocapsa sp.]